MHETLLAKVKGTGCRCSTTDGVLKCTLQNLEGRASSELACEVDRTNKIVIRGKYLMCELHKIGKLDPSDSAREGYLEILLPETIQSTEIEVSTSDGRFVDRPACLTIRNNQLTEIACKRSR